MCVVLEADPFSQGWQTHANTAHFFMFPVSLFSFIGLALLSLQHYPALRVFKLIPNISQKDPIKGCLGKLPSECISILYAIRQ